MSRAAVMDIFAIATFALPALLALFFTVEQVQAMVSGIGPGFAIWLLIFGALAQITIEAKRFRGES